MDTYNMIALQVEVPIRTEFFQKINFSHHTSAFLLQIRY